MRFRKHTWFYQNINKANINEHREKCTLKYNESTLTINRPEHITHKQGF